MPEPSVSEGLCSGDKDQGYPCETCGKVFKQQTNLYRHKKQHKGVRALFLCLKCNRNYTRKDILQKHLKKGKCFESGNELECKKCRKKYKQKCSLNRHLRTHQEDKIGDKGKSGSKEAPGNIKQMRETNSGVAIPDFTDDEDEAPLVALTPVILESLGKEPIDIKSVRTF